MAEVLREPKGAFQELVRCLADDAVSVTCHDIGDGPEYVHAIQSMERAFTKRLRGYLSARSREANRRALATQERPDER